MRIWLLTGAILIAGCSSSPQTDDMDGPTGDPAAPGMNQSLVIPDGVVIAQGDMTIRWDYDSDGFEAWAATLYLPQPAKVAWHAFPSGGGGGGGGGGGNAEPELFALLAHPDPGLPCQDFSPLLEKWAVSDFTDTDEAQLPAGWYHVLFATDNSNGGGGLDINGGSNNTTAGPMESPMADAVAFEEFTGSFGGGGLDESMAIDAGVNRSWFLWVQASTGPSFLPRLDNGFELHVATDDGCYDESVTGPGPLTSEEQAIRIHGSGNGATTLSATYEQNAPTSSGDTGAMAAALVVTGDPDTGNVTAPP